MYKTQYFLLSIILIALTSSLAYATYPLNPDESLGVIHSAGQRREPGFISGITGAGSVEGYITITGVVVEHGTLEVDDKELPYIVVVTQDGKTFTVILGSKFEEHMRHEHWSEEEIKSYPGKVVNQRVIVTGIKTSVDNIVVATSTHLQEGQLGNHDNDGSGEWHGRGK